VGLDVFLEVAKVFVAESARVGIAIPDIGEFFGVDVNDINTRGGARLGIFSAQSIACDQAENGQEEVKCFHEGTFPILRKTHPGTKKFRRESFEGMSLK
jgi:hypothetical protein